MKNIENTIRKWMSDLESWLQSEDLWYDSSIKNYLDYFDSEPGVSPELFVLTSEGPLWFGINYGDSEIENKFDSYIDKQPYYYEIESSCVFIFYLKDENDIKEFYDYFYWKWLVKNMKSEYQLLHNDLYTLISDDESYLKRLTPREFEFFIDKIYQDMGYKTIIGPGTNDKGIDLRIITKDGTGLILSQIKQYSMKNAIHLEAVKALCWDVYEQNAEKGLFITTSRYLPGVKNFAKDKRIELADTNDILMWAKSASTQNNQLLLNAIYYVKNHKQELIDLDLKKCFDKILIDTHGVNMIINTFYLNISEFMNIAFVIKISAYKITDQYGQIGYNLPKITEHDLTHNSINIAKKKDQYYSFDRTYLHKWNGEAAYFNYMD